jgi:flagellar hook-length control protein FliK
VPSIASDVSAALLSGPSQWPQVPSPTQQTDGQPFAALLDASTTGDNPASPTPPAQAPASPSSTQNQNQNNGDSDPNSSGSSASATAGPSATDAAKPGPNASGRHHAGPGSTDQGTDATLTVTSAGKNRKTTNSGNVTAKAATAGNAPSSTTSGDTKSNTTPPTPTKTNDSTTPANATNEVGASPQATANAAANANAATRSNGQAPAPDEAANPADVVAATGGLQSTATHGPLAKTPVANSKTDPNRDSNGTDDGTAPTTSSQPQAVNQPQPVAAAIVLNTAAETTPGAAGPSDSSTAIGEANKGRTRSALVVEGDRDTSDTQQDGPTDPTAKPAASANGSVNTAPAPSAAPVRTQAANDSAPQQGPTRERDDAAALPQATKPASSNDDQATTPAALPPAIASSDATTPATSNAQGGTGAGKADTGGLPNFGFSPAATAASTATPTTTPTTPAAGATNTAPPITIPIAGLAVAIAARAQAGSNQFEIKLSPPELGRIDVQLNVDGNGQVTSHMTVDRPATLQLLQSQQPQLQSALEQAGLTTADNGLQFSLRDQSFAGQNNGSGQQSAPAQLVIPEPDLAPIAATQIYTRAGLGRGVDIRV